MPSRATRAVRAVMAVLFLFWASAPCFAAEPAPTCLDSLRKIAVSKGEMTLTRSDGETFRGRLAKLDPGGGLLELTVYDPEASRFSTLEFDEREILDLTYRRDTTDTGYLVLFVAATTFLSGFIGYKVVDEWGEESSSGSGRSNLGAGLVGFLGGVSGLVLGMILAPKSSEEVRLDCRPAGP